MSEELLLGDEAVGLGAIDAGIGGAFSYPGTPSTEIFEFIEKRTSGSAAVQALWSANEKVAYEQALGMSYAGQRVIVSMKHVGLNVAADPFMSSALTGVGGGFVLAVADDPGMHSSQNEQDSRYYADFAGIPCFEPANQQEAYDATREAFNVSERFDVPVMVRLVTRLAHSRARVRAGGSLSRFRPRVSPNGYPDRTHWTLLPVNARRRFRRLVDLQKSLREYTEKSPFNVLRLAGGRGVIATGIARNYVGEILGAEHDWSLLKISAYPFPVALIREIVDHCHDLLVVEEGYPYLESRLTGLLGLPGRRIRGRRSGDLRPTGELTPESIATALDRPAAASRPEPAAINRPPSLCEGCPHADTFRAMKDAVAGRSSAVMMSDIGCYTLGYAPEFGTVHTCVDMGASIAMAHGAALAGAYPVLCTIGDSTFGHSGVGPLLDAVRHDTDMTVIVLDNGTVAMTGTQESATTGEPLMRLLRGLGVPEDHLKLIEPTPRNHRANVEAIAREVHHRGLSVIVARRACIHVRRQTTARCACGAARPAPVH